MYSAKLSFKSEGDIKTFSGKKKMRKTFFFSGPAF